jgi:enoyl-CoA hydratase/carnithine racemase
MTPLALNLGPPLQAFVGDDGVAELVFGPAGGMPFTDLQGHAALGGIWQRLAREPGVRAILVRSVGKGFCAGGSPDVVQGLLDDHAARLRVMREGREIVQGMIEPLQASARQVALQLAAGCASALAFTKRSLNHWLRAAWPALEHSLALEMIGFAGPDAREGVAAVGARRTPEFTR